MACKSWRYEVFENRFKKFLAFMFLRFREDFSYKSSSMKSVRAAAIMFVSVARHHSAKHFPKCANPLRFSISLKFKNLDWMLVPVNVGRTLGLDLNVLERLRGIQFGIKKKKKKKNVLDLFLRSAPYSRTFSQMCTTVTLRDELEFRKVVTRSLERFLNLRCPAVSDLLRFRFFIQLR